MLVESFLVQEFFIKIGIRYWNSDFFSSGDLVYLLRSKSIYIYAIVAYYTYYAYLLCVNP